VKLARTRTLLASAVLVAAAVGFLEASAMALIGAPAGGFTRALAAWSVSFSFASLGALPVAVLLLAAIGVVAWSRLGQDTWRDLRVPGPARARVAWRALLAAAATGVFALLSFELAAATYRAYADREPGLFGAFIAAGVTAFGLVVGFAALAIDRQVGERVAASRFAARAVNGWPRRVTVAVLAVAAVAVPLVIVHVSRPEIHPLVSIAGSALVLIVVAVRAPRARPRGRGQLLSVGLFAVMVAGLFLVPASDAGRARVASHGLVSRTGFVSLSRAIGDRDGDSYAAHFFGGADCNDHARGENPRAIDVPANGVDENCTGADADAAWEAERFTSRPPSDATAPRRNVLLVSFDATRADHTSAYGYERDTTPTIARLGQTGTRFARAFTPQPLTRQAIASLLTGRLPSTILWHRRMKAFWKESRAVTIAQALGHAGYDTAMISCCDRFAKADPGYTYPGFAFTDVSPTAGYGTTEGRANSDLVAAGAVKWLSRRSASSPPFFLYMHLIDAHAPYEVPKGGKSFGEASIDMYDAEIHFADQNLGLILAKLDELGFAGNTIVVVTADHGEEFMEHGVKYHGRSLYNQVVHVPLVMRVPGAAARVVDTPVSLVDIAPTLLDLVGVEGPPGMSGRSLATAVRGGDAAVVRPLLLEVYPEGNVERDLVGVIADGMKIIWDREANSFSLYSIDDVEDADDLSYREPERVATMKKILFDTIDRELSSTLDASKRKKRRKSRK
jgi:arylsulfatase A-like enzyme